MWNMSLVTETLLVLAKITYSQTIKTTGTTYQYSGTFRIYIDKPCDYAREQTLIKFDDNDASSFFLLDGKLTVGQRNVWQMAGAQPMKRSGNIATAVPKP